MKTEGTFDTIGDAILHAYQIAEIGEWIYFHRDVATVKHENTEDCPCGLIAVEKSAGMTGEQFVRHVRQEIGN